MKLKVEQSVHLILYLESFLEDPVMLSLLADVGFLEPSEDCSVLSDFAEVIATVTWPENFNMRTRVAYIVF